VRNAVGCGPDKSAATCAGNLTAMGVEAFVGGKIGERMGSPAGGRAAKSAEEPKAAPKKPAADEPDLGRKLEYFFGNATGRAHNIKRSGDMVQQLNRVGLQDNAAGRAAFAQHLRDVYADPKSVVKTDPETGRVTRSGFLAAPGGFLSTETIWEGNRLITGLLYGNNSRFSLKDVRSQTGQKR